jgi:hypothetical protein
MTQAATEVQTCTPSTSMVDDLERQVQHSLGSHVRHFHLLRRGDGLILKGHTRTYYAKQLAQQLVMRSNQRVLANEIEVA